ncbi:MAG: type II toxin-antitoxin system prevent-host-death family antitoxin [Actinomycetota bacterium]|jgi:prevent-host-death family protein
MAEIGIRALKQNASAVVARVAAGEVIVVTDRGRPVAQLSPLPSGRLSTLHATGQARPPKRSLAELPAPSRGPSITEVLLAMRHDERG